MSVVPEKKGMGWYAPAAVAVFGLGLYIARKKKIQLRFTNDSNTYIEVDKSLLPLDPTSRVSTTLDISSISPQDLDRLKSWWANIGMQAAHEEPTTLPQNILQNFLDLKQDHPQNSIDQLLTQLSRTVDFE